MFITYTDVDESCWFLDFIDVPSVDEVAHVVTLSDLCQTTYQKYDHKVSQKLSIKKS